jgi:predicted 3-demethylubiquinone-9 3-methyltransferase (glyoxalase superfamily)
MATQKIRTFLWFDDQAEEAVDLYTSVFKNARILGKTPGPNGRIMTITFELEGQQFIALNGGPIFKFTEAISLSVDCQTQAEVDDLWDKLTANGGSPGRCGWLTDKFGLSWQIIPRQLGELMQSGDPLSVKRVIDAMLQMGKIDIAGLERAAES